MTVHLQCVRTRDLGIDITNLTLVAAVTFAK
jgi:hypothetical protein